MGSYDIITLTDERYETPDETNWYQAQLLGEERLLMAGLEARGLSTARVAWSNPDFDWRRVRGAVFRSTWDYFERFAEFSAWMDRIAGETQLFNAPELVRWNVDKHYLRELAERGVNVPETQFIERGETTTLREVFAVCGRNEVILKPAVSGAARHISPVPLTSVDSNLRGMGYAAAELLQRLMSGSPAPAAPVVIAPHGVIERTSTAAFVCADKRIAATVRRIRRDFAEPLAVGTLACEAAMSVRALQTGFKAATGHSLREELIRCGLTCAERLLEDTDLKIQAVAIECGLGDAKSLTRFFHQKHQRTPNAYRQAFRSKSL